jgi:hypothetical protein
MEWNGTIDRLMHRGRAGGRELKATSANTEHHSSIRERTKRNTRIYPFIYHSKSYHEHSTTATSTTAAAAPSRIEHRKHKAATTVGINTYDLLLDK